MLALLEHPDQIERLRQEPALIKPAVEELLRYTTPVFMSTERYAREDVTLHGATIPRGEMTLGRCTAGAHGSANCNQHVAAPDAGLALESLTELIELAPQYDFTGAGRAAYRISELRMRFK